MASINSRRYACGAVSWRVQFRIDKKLQQKFFRNEKGAREFGKLVARVGGQAAREVLASSPTWSAITGSGSIMPSSIRTPLARDRTLTIPLLRSMSMCPPASRLPSASDGELWQPPPKSECDENEIPVPLTETDRLTMRRVRWNGQLVEYAIIYSRRDAAGNWKRVIGIDTMHRGYVHRHDGPINITSPTLLRRIYSQNDVQESWNDSYDEVYDVFLTSTENRPDE